MRVLTLSALLAALATTLAALVPCLGPLNKIAVPLSFGAAAFGVLGLLVDRDPETERVRDPNTYLAALLVGIALVVFGIVRCSMGGEPG